jgi:hypothetical protein
MGSLIPPNRQRSNPFSSSYPESMPRRRLLSLLPVLMLVLAPAARAAELTISVDEGERGVHWGESHQINGTLTSDGRTPLAGQQVALESRPFPFEDPFEQVATATTRADGTFSFEIELTRNSKLRALAPAAKARSKQVTAHLFPATRLSFRQVRPGVVRITQDYRVPRSAGLGGKTLFYVAPAKAKTSRINRLASTRRVSAGHFRARVTVKVPSSYNGRFRYAACYRYSPGSGLGDPKISCPRSGYRF